MTEITIPIWSVIVMGASAIAGLYALVTRLLFKFVGNGSSLKTSLNSLKAPPMPQCACPGIDPDKFVTKELCSQTQQTMHAEMKTITQEVKHTHELLDNRFDRLTKIVEQNNH